MEKPKGTLFVSIPSLLDPSLAPEGTHVFHAFTPDWIDAYQVRARALGVHISCMHSLSCC